MSVERNHFINGLILKVFLKPQQGLKFTWIILPFFSLLFFFADDHNLRRSLEEKGNIEQVFQLVNEGSISRRVSLLGLLIISTISLIRKERRLIKINGTLGWLLLFYIIWAFLSLAWTIDHRLTFRRLVVLIIFLIAALAFAERFTLKTFILWVFYTTSLFVIVGLFVEIALGSFQPFSKDYRFTGTLHANHQGINCSILLFSSISLIMNTKRIQKLFLGFVITAVIFLFLTKSRTSIFCAILSLFFYWFFNASIYHKYFLFIFTGFTTCLSLLLFGDDIHSFLYHGALLGRSTEIETLYTLNSRTSLWRVCLSYIWQRFFIGYGYGGFWTPGHISLFSEAQAWFVGESHSAYFEQALQLGVIGLLSYIFILKCALLRALISLKKERGYGQQFIVLLIIYCIFHGLLESAVVSHKLVMFLLIVGLLQIGFKYFPLKESCFLQQKSVKQVHQT